jgi:peptidoglycan/xylan/chitin deacetylase (PgdA/CDA1 family)
MRRQKGLSRLHRHSRVLAGGALLLACMMLTPFRPADAADVASDLAVGVADSDYRELRRRLVAKYGSQQPQEWGESVTGVKKRLNTRDRVIALTFDACGSARGMGVDRELLAFLEREQVPATLFINGRWIGPNRETFASLAGNPLFEIANHGSLHKPASVTGRSAYGIAGTRDAGELVDEIEMNARRIQGVTGRRPRYYRSGTAYYDEVAVRVAGDLGQQVAGFSVLGDAGATYSAEQVRQTLLRARPGDIVILHLNHPEAGTGKGVMAAVPELRKRGFRFVLLSEYDLE